MRIPSLLPSILPLTVVLAAACSAEGVADDTDGPRDSVGGFSADGGTDASMDARADGSKPRKEPKPAPTPPRPPTPPSPPAPVDASPDGDTAEAGSGFPGTDSGNPSSKPDDSGAPGSQGDGSSDQADAAAEDPTTPEGAPCQTADGFQERTCGVCGKQLRLCRRNDDGGLVWDAWGFCQGEKADGCVPGSKTQEACGNCGVREIVCGSDCRPTPTFCIEPSGAECSPGQVDYVPGLSCPSGRGRYRKCRDRQAGPLACTFEPFSSCVSGLPASGELVLGSNAGPGAIIAGDFRVSGADDKIPVIEVPYGADQVDDCPARLSSTMSRYSYIAIRNETGKKATLSVWTSPSEAENEGERELDTVMAIYPRDSVPMVSADRLACSGYVNNNCSSGPCPSGGTFAGLTSEMETSRRGGPAVKDILPRIEPNGVALVYVAIRWDNFTGKPGYRLNVRIDALE